MSKNTESIAQDAIENHPEMVLTLEDFAGWRINWQDKATNIMELAAELRLGLQSMVFIDDQGHERERVSSALPEVLVPDWPSDKLLYPSALEKLDCFDAAALTVEDRERSSLYAAERQRRTLQQEVPSLDDWIAGLKIRVRVESFNESNAVRICQLMNRTNQMNLQTRRMTQSELENWISSSHQRTILGFRVSDRFGDAGLCGVVGIEVNGDVATLSDFLMSCRVIGRKIENVMLNSAIEIASKANAARLEARYKPTSKNEPCLQFFDQSGLNRDGSLFFWTIGAAYSIPDFIKVDFHNQDGEIHSK